MQTIHLYDKQLQELGIIESFCKESNIKPGVNAVPVRNPQISSNYLTFCQKCIESEDYILWHLGTYK